MMEISVRQFLAEPMRLRALAASGLLEDAPHRALACSTGLARLCLGVPVALVTIVDAERQVLWGQQDLPEPWCSIGGMPLSYSFCQYVVASGEALAVADAAAHPLGAANLAVQDFGVAAYLGMPVRGPGGQVLGALCAVDVVPRAWTERDVKALQGIAEDVAAEIAAWRRPPAAGAMA